MYVVHRLREEKAPSSTPAGKRGLRRQETCNTCSKQPETKQRVSRRTCRRLAVALRFQLRALFLLPVSEQWAQRLGCAAKRFEKGSWFQLFKTMQRVHAVSHGLHVYRDVHETPMNVRQFVNANEE